MSCWDKGFEVGGRAEENSRVTRVWCVEVAYLTPDPASISPVRGPTSRLLRRRRHSPASIEQAALWICRRPRAPTALAAGVGVAELNKIRVAVHEK